MTTVPFPDRGVASFEALDTWTNQYLLTGAEPPLEDGYAYPLANSTSFAQHSVVGLDGNGKVAMATYDNTVRAIGILAHSASLGASGNGNAILHLSGNFNMDALVWHATFDTDAKKKAAFRGAPTPTRIVIGKRGTSL